MRENQRRNKQARSQWRKLVGEQERSEQSVTTFCRERGLRRPQFYWWKNRLREESGETKFVAVEVRGEEERRERTAIEVRLRKGRSVVVEAGFDAEHLRALLAVLEVEG